MTTVLKYQKMLWTRWYGFPFNDNRGQISIGYRGPPSGYCGQWSTVGNLEAPYLSTPTIDRLYFRVNYCQRQRWGRLGHACQSQLRTAWNQ